jgi:glycosyltransferase involved in cell wall biosynthesis
MGTGRTAPSLRILVLTNLYPPFYLGGYELGCHDVVERLRERGHSVAVLTSTYGVSGERRDGHIYRHLSFRCVPDRRSRLGLLRSEWKQQAALRRVFGACTPDVVYVFSLYGVSHGLMLAAQRTGRPVVYAFSGEWLEPAHGGDPWLQLWTHANRGIKGSAKRAIGRVLDRVTPVGLEPLDLRGAYFTSAALRDRFVVKGFPVGDAPVIHWGVDTTHFSPAPQTVSGGSIRVLFAGRIAPEKGLHTVVEALGLLRERGDVTATLDVAGPTQDASYLATLRGRIAASGIANRVGFLGVLSRENMPQVYRSHDALVLPSIWDEPFSIGLLEAMASGLAVVGTTTGGSREILADGINALTFSPGDAEALATQIGRLTSADLRQRLGRAARRTVEERFTLAAMLERIEEFLQNAASGRTALRSRG